ncbi:hypothetical protein [Burkholderia cepacia]|nr:hypothetical protein [Burkholderia cepacia]
MTTRQMDMDDALKVLADEFGSRATLNESSNIYQENEDNTKPL